MRNKFAAILAILAILAAFSCRDNPSDGGEDTLTRLDGAGQDGSELDTVPMDVPENARWVQPAGTAKITFWVDDRANKTFSDGDMVWTGSFAWNEADNTIAPATSWLPTDGPYPLLYDDGPVSQGGHEMEGAEAGDSIFSTEVYFKAEEETLFQYGVLNELGFWMWEGPNGTFTIPAGSTETVDAVGQTLKAFGNIDIKITVNTGDLHPDFAYIQDWSGVNVYVKGNMNMWTPLQVLDNGPEGGKGDEVAGDGVFTYVQSLNLGTHTGLLAAGQKAQFTVVFAKAEESWDMGVEYKILLEGKQKGAKNGIEAFTDCSGQAQWSWAEVVWELDSWGTTENTTVEATCDFVPECTEGDDTCGDGQKCVSGVCREWCDTDDECGDGEKCKGNKCMEWCDSEEDCPEGQVCLTNKCQIQTIVSEPLITALLPDTGPSAGGTLVTISGSEFLDGATVTFDNVAATSITVVSDSELTCVTPAHAAGKVDVTLTNPDTGTTKFLKGYTFVDQSLAPVISGVEPTSGSVNGGTEVSIYGQNFMPEPGVFFGTKQSQTVTFVDSGHVKAVAPSGTLGKVDVRLVNSDSQEDTLAEAFTYVPNVVDYAKLLAPVSVDSLSEVESELLLSEVWENGITPGDGAGANLTVELGYGAVGSDPQDAPESWTWQAAQYQGESGNNDLWGGTLTMAEAGTWAFTFRFSMDAGDTWVYADTDGSVNGFSKDLLGTISVIDPGDDPFILSVQPSFGSILGGTVVTITGFNFADGSMVSFGDAEVAPSSVTSTQITVTAPAHGLGSVDLKVTGPEVPEFVRDSGFEFLLIYTPVVDGEVTEDWPADFLAAENTLESNWIPEELPGYNTLSRMWVSYNQDNLYIAVEGLAEDGNYIIGYVDRDFGAGTGFADMTALGDNNGNGDLDDALSNVIHADVEGFGAEVGFGARGVMDFWMDSDLGGSTFSGWRELSPADNFGWFPGTIVHGEGGSFEAVYPLANLFPAGVIPAGGVELGIFLKLTGPYGGAMGMSNQCLPECNDEDVTAVQQVYGIRVR